MKALIVRARMIANVLHLGGRYEGARTLGECADALESLFAQANEAVARLNEAVAVEKAYGFTIQEFQGDIERERENTRRCQRELNKVLDAVTEAQRHLHHVHTFECRQTDTGVCSDCDTEKARKALAKAGVR